MRTFLAVEIPEEQLAELERLSGKLQRAAVDSRLSIRWTRRSQYHLTLRFFGDLDPQRRGLAEEAVSEVIERFGKFSVGPGFLGTFPNWKNPRVLWAGITFPPELREFAAELDDRFAQVGLGRADEEFRPHITLARIKRGPFGLLAQLLSEFRGKKWGGEKEFSLSRVTLFKSELFPSGAVYTPIRRWELD